MRTPLEEFKAQLAGWFAMQDWKPIDGVWRTRDEWGDGRGVPDWVGVVLYIEEHELFYTLNGFGDTVDDYNQFESLMQKCNVWWEMENGCVCWIYDPKALDEYEKRMGING